MPTTSQLVPMLGRGLIFWAWGAFAFWGLSRVNLGEINSGDRYLTVPEAIVEGFGFLLIGAVFQLIAVVVGYRRAAAPIEFRVERGRLEVSEGSFDPNAAKTLEVIEVDARRDRYGLVFAGGTVARATAIGAPGIPREAAVGIRAAVLARYGA